MKSEPWLAVKDHAGRIREFLSVGNFMPSAESHRSEITWDSWISVMLVTKVQTECNLFQIILRQRWRTHLYIAACWSTVGSPWIQTNCSNNRSYWKTRQQHLPLQSRWDINNDTALTICEWRVQKTSGNAVSEDSPPFYSKMIFQALVSIFSSIITIT